MFKLAQASPPIVDEDRVCGTHVPLAQCLLSRDYGTDGAILKTISSKSARSSQRGRTLSSPRCTTACRPLDPNDYGRWLDLDITNSGTVLDCLKPFGCQPYEEISGESSRESSRERR